MQVAAIVIVGINVDNTRAGADRFLHLQKYPASFPLVFDPQGVLAVSGCSRIVVLHAGSIRVRQPHDGIPGVFTVSLPRL